MIEVVSVPFLLGEVLAELVLITLALWIVSIFLPTRILAIAILGLLLPLTITLVFNIVGSFAGWWETNEVLVSAVHLVSLMLGGFFSAIAIHLRLAGLPDRRVPG